MRAYLATPLLLLCTITAASAGTLVATHPGAMCRRPEALARIIRPDGSSQANTAFATPADNDAARSGGCIPIPPGARVRVQVAHHNTSIVSYDAGDGRGAQTFIVPNIDFEPAPDSAGGGACISEGGKITLSGRVSRGLGLTDGETEAGGTYPYALLTPDHPVCLKTDEAPTGVMVIRAALKVVHGSGLAMVGSRVTASGELDHPDAGLHPEDYEFVVDHLTRTP